jgi:hypothetical protein
MVHINIKENGKGNRMENLETEKTKKT